MRWSRTFFIGVVFLATTQTSQAADFTLTSPQLQPGKTMDNEQVLNGYGCQGSNISPELYWQNSPENAKSYAVTVYDPDAPTGSGWWHWVMFNIPAEVTGLERNAGGKQSNLRPIGSIQSRTDFGSPGYGGACPPRGHGMHRYVFSVHALNTEKLNLDANATAAMVGFFINQHVIAKAELTVTYSR